MEKIKTKWMLELITILCIIATILFSSISPIIAWAIEENNNESEQDQYVTFDANWSTGGKEISGTEGQRTVKFDLQFDTLESFMNVKLEIGKVDNGSIALNNVGEYFLSSSNSTSGGKIQYFKDIPGGTKITGYATIGFAKTADYSSYTDVIPITLTGYYEVDGEIKEIKITKTLTATIKPSPDTYYHTASLYSLGSISPTYSSNTSTLMKVSGITVYFYTWTNVSRSEKCELKLNLYRTDKNGNKYYPSSVTFSNSSFTMTKSGEEDGIYIFTRGEEHDECDEANLFSISQNKNSSYARDTFSINYKIDDPEAQVSTTLYNYALLTSTGYEKTIDENGTSYKKTVLTSDRPYNVSQVLYRYTPGGHNWGNTGIRTTKSQNSIMQQDLTNAIANKKIEVPFDTYFTHVTTGYDVEGDCTISRYNSHVRIYNPSNRTYSFRDFKEGEFCLKSINLTKMPNDEGVIEFYKEGATNPFFIATNENLSYTVPDGEIIANFNMVVKNIQYNRIYGYIRTTYEMNTEKMKQNGMTDDTIKNIRNIYMGQRASGPAYYTEKDSVAGYNISNFEKTKVSHLFLPSNTKIEATAQEIGKKVSGKLYFNIGYDSSISKNLTEMELSATNPILYIRLPDQFDFDIKNVTSNISNLIIDSYKIKKLSSLNGTKVLQINCKGRIAGNGYSTITVDYDRILKSGVMYSNVQTVVHMETDEGEYYRQEADGYDENENGNTSENMAYAYVTNSIGYSQTIQLKNSIKNKLGEYVSGQDVILEQGDTAHYRTVLENDYNTIKKINLVTRLPFIDNKSIMGNTVELGSEFTLINLNNIKVYRRSRSGAKTEVPSSNYTIKYSTDAEAGFDSEFTSDIEDINTVKTMQILFNDNYLLGSGYMLMIEFDMDLPEGIEKEKVTYETSAVRYYYYYGNQKNEQEAAKQKVIIGDPTGEIEVVKEFEGTKTKESKENIKFRITNIDNPEEYYEKLTDSKGHATFTKVPVGEWEIKEITEFNGYICVPKYVKITSGEKYTENSAITMRNKIKYSKLTVKKEWQDTNEIPGSVDVTISGKTIGEDDFSKEVSLYVATNPDGSKYQETSIYVPYGTYTLHEKSECDGWYSDDVEVTVDKPEIDGILTNKPTKGTMQIIKTVPEGETVLGLTFKIVGTGALSYKNKQGELVEFVTEKEVTVSEGNPDVIISEDKRTATINVSDLATGYYWVEEVKMPTIQIDGMETIKYASVKQRVYIPNKKDVIVPVNIENKYRAGNLKVTVTATEGTDLSLFKVKVTGISIFGNEYSEEFDVPDTGKLTIKNLEIGKYKVEEVGTKEVNGKIITTNPDGYEVTYNPTDVSSNGVKVEYEKTANAAIHNEYNGKGYVKILKSLEDEEDASKAEGIKFRIRGKDLTGNQVFEELTIGKDGTATSSEIPVGTYLLEEIEETVPEKYQVMEEREVKISSENTEENPLELDIENKLAIRKNSNGNRNRGWRMSTKSSNIYCYKGRQ